MPEEPPAGFTYQYQWTSSEEGVGVIGDKQEINVSVADDHSVTFYCEVYLVGESGVKCSLSEEYQIDCGSPPPPADECGLTGTFAAIKHSNQPSSWTLSLTAEIVGYPPSVDPVNVTWDIFAGQQVSEIPVATVYGVGPTASVLYGSLAYSAWYTIRMTVVDARGCVASSVQLIKIDSSCPDGKYFNGLECVDKPDEDGDPPPTFPPCADGFHWDVEAKACVPSWCSVVPGAPAQRSGGRLVPSAMYEELITTWNEHFWVLCIKPLYGDWEAYNSVDIAFTHPSYTSKNGKNPIPSLVSLPSRGVDISSVANTLKLEADSTDAIIVNFDQKKVRNGYYQKATYELFRVTPSDLSLRWVASSGTIGLSQTGEIDATIELISWEDMAQKPIGDDQTYLCRHQFGVGGCRNSMLNNGPLLADWTRYGSVIEEHNRSRFTVRLTGTSGSGDVFFDRLRDGQVYFAGGDNEYLMRDIKQGAWVAGSGDVVITLREIANYLPQVGDAVHVMAGCVKNPEMCKQYDNIKNYGGFLYIPLREGVMNRA
jgi:hypothetical protein